MAVGEEPLSGFPLGVGRAGTEERPASCCAAAGPGTTAAERRPGGKGDNPAGDNPVGDNELGENPVGDNPAVVGDTGDSPPTPAVMGGTTRRFAAALDAVPTTGATALATGGNGVNTMEPADIDVRPRAELRRDCAIPARGFLDDCSDVLFTDELAPAEEMEDAPRAAISAAVARSRVTTIRGVLDSLATAT